MVTRTTRPKLTTAAARILLVWVSNAQGHIEVVASVFSVEANFACFLQRKRCGISHPTHIGAHLGIDINVICKQVCCGENFYVSCPSTIIFHSWAWEILSHFLTGITSELLINRFWGHVSHHNITHHWVLFFWACQKVTNATNAIKQFPSPLVRWIRRGALSSDCLPIEICLCTVRPRASAIVLLWQPGTGLK